MADLRSGVVVTPEMIKEFERLAEEKGVDLSDTPEMYKPKEKVSKKEQLKKNYKQFYEDKAVNEILGEDVRDTKKIDAIQNLAGNTGDLTLGNLLGRLFIGMKGAQEGRREATRVAEILNPLKTPKNGIIYENPEGFNKAVDDVIKNLGELRDLTYTAKNQKIGALGGSVLSILLSPFGKGMGAIKAHEIGKAKKRLLNELYPDNDINSMDDKALESFISEHIDELKAKLN